VTRSIAPSSPDRGRRADHPSTHHEGHLPPARLLVLLIGGLLGPAAIRAQAAAEAAPRTVPPVGAVVRVTLHQREVAVRPEGRPVGAVRPVGRVVAADSAQFSVRFADGWVQAFPASSVQRLDVRAGPGLCRGGAGRRVGCAAVGLAAGALIGAVVLPRTVPSSGQAIPGFGEIFARNEYDVGLDERRRRARRNGAILGGGLGAAVGVSVGLDRWKRVR
jgi:hypothetical protein